ncbi:MAG: transposase [bacterium]|nr:transposase [bacterium]
MDAPAKLMTNDEVAVLLGIKLSTLWSWVRQGIFPAPDIQRKKFSRYSPDTFATGVARLRQGAVKAAEPPPMLPSTNKRLDAALAHSTPPPAKGDRQRQRYTAEQRAHAVKQYHALVDTGKMTAATLARQLGVKQGSLTAWAIKSR